MSTSALALRRNVHYGEAFNVMQCPASMLLNDSLALAHEVSEKGMTEAGCRKHVFAGHCGLSCHHTCRTLLARSHGRVLSHGKPLRHPCDFCALQAGDIATQLGEVGVWICFGEILQNRTHGDGPSMMGHHTAHEVHIVLATEIYGHATMHFTVCIDECHGRKALRFPTPIGHMMVMIHILHVLHAL